MFIRAAGFGAGSVLSFALICGVAFWWTNRPKPWIDSTIIAKFNQMDAQKRGEQLNLTFEYTLYNATNEDYVLPAVGSGALMRQMPKTNGGLDKMEDTSWDNNVTIPPKQSVNIKFLVPYKFADYNTSAKEFGQPDWTSSGLVFVNRRLDTIDGFVFFDYGRKFKIILPKWPAVAPSK